MDKYTKWRARWPNFPPDEVLSPDGLALFERMGVVLVQPHALDWLERCRSKLGVPLLVNMGKAVHRGYRSTRENKAVGGEDYSMHMMGLAFDITPSGMSLEDFHKYAISDESGFSGVGYYPKANFVHVDLRFSFDNKKYLWTA